jgi:hypothetical protein
MGRRVPGSRLHFLSYSRQTDRREKAGGGIFPNESNYVSMRGRKGAFNGSFCRLR